MSIFSNSAAYGRALNANGWGALTVGEIAMVKGCGFTPAREVGDDKYVRFFGPPWMIAVLEQEPTYAGRQDLISFVMEHGDDDLRAALDAASVANPASVVEMIEDYGKTLDPDNWGALDDADVEEGL